MGSEWRRPRSGCREIEVTAGIGGFGLPVVEIEADHVEPEADIMAALHPADVGAVRGGLLDAPDGDPRLRVADVAEAEVEVRHTALADVGAVGPGDAEDVGAPV